MFVVTRCSRVARLFLYLIVVRELRECVALELLSITQKVYGLAALL